MSRLEKELTALSQRVQLLEIQIKPPRFATGNNVIWHCGYYADDVIKCEIIGEDRVDLSGRWYYVAMREKKYRWIYDELQRVNENFLTPIQ